MDAIRWEQVVLAQSAEKNKAGWHRRMAAHLWWGIAQSLRHAEPNIIGMGTVGLIGFPLYYFIWAYLFPQPYENLPLRLLGSLLFALLMTANSWPRPLRALLPLYWYLTLLYSLPFFFVFMLLKNEGDTVWLLSTMAAIFLMILLLDWLNLILMSVLGAALGWLAYRFTTPGALSLSMFGEYMAVFGFAIVASSIFNYRSELLKREKMEAIFAVGGHIAHELRTPLLSISAGAAGLKRYLPSLIESYRVARQSGLPVPPIREAHFRELVPVLDRIEAETEYSNVIIDMLLTNSTTAMTDRNDFAVRSMADCVDKALARYPFKSEGERTKVIWPRENDFKFFGSELLTIHIIFNLLKNALYAIGVAGKGQVFVWMETGTENNRLHVKDTGTGISPEVLPHIFLPFYTNGKSGKGAGMGLAFCRLVMEGLGGKIRCESKRGEYTEFVLVFKGASESA